MINSNKFNDSINEMLKIKESEILNANEIINKEIASNKKITKKMSKKFNDNLGIDIDIGNFKKSIFIREEDYEIVSCESLGYHKRLIDGDFSIFFYYDEKNDKVNSMSIRTESINTTFNVDIFLEKDFFVNRITVLNFSDEEPTVLHHSQNDKISSFLSSLTEDSLTQLDTEEYQDLIQISLDYNLDLTKYPAYENFKIGFKTFLEELKLGNKNKNTMRPKI